MTRYCSHSFVAISCAALIAALFAHPWAYAADALRFDFSPSPLAAKLQEAGKGKKALPVPRCAEPPKVDGRLDDAAWRSAARLDLALGRTAAADTVARVCYDDAAIYLAVECSGPAEGVAAPVNAERDSGDLWKADHVEAWLAPAAKGTGFQFAVDLRGLIYDGTVSGAAADAGYSPEWSHAVARGADGWTAEAAIPKAALRLKTWPQSIGFDIGRDGSGRTARSWTGNWGSTDGGVLVLEGIAPEVPATTDAAAPASAAAGSALAVSIERPFARPGDRWIEAGLKIAPALAAKPQVRLSAALFALGEDTPAATATATPARPEGRLLADLRALRLKGARLRVALRDGDTPLAVSEHFLTAQEPETPLAAGTRIPITIDPPAGAQVEDYPVTFGVPFASGALWDLRNLRVTDAQGKEIPHQKQVTARWAPEGAIRWVRFDALASSKAGCFVEVAAPGADAAPAKPVNVAEKDGKVVLDTGAARYTLARGPSPIQEVWLGDACLARSAGARGLYVVDQKGRTGVASADGEKMEIELSGPVAACVRFEGFYKTPDRASLARHITRVEAFAGQPFARVTHTLVLTNDTNEVWFREVGWEFAASPGANPRAVFATSREDFGKSQAVRLQPGTAARMLQDEHYRFGAGKNHFAVSQVVGGKATTAAEGEECGDYALLLGEGGGVMMACKEAARQHPKEFEARPDRIALKLFSNAAGEELDFRMASLVRKWNLAEWIQKSMSKWEQERVPANVLEVVGKYESNACGWAKTHDLLISPANSAESAASLARLNSRGVFAHTDPAWVCRSGAIGRIHPKDPQRFPHEEALIDATFGVWEKRALAGWGNYGFVDYGAGPTLEYWGDVPRMYRYVTFTYSLRSDLWMQYARSGDRRVRELAELTNRTYLDNVYSHWDSNERTAGLPLMPAGGDYFPQNGCFPAYWQGKHYPNLMSSSNMDQFAWFYYLTGSGRAKDGVLEYADGVRRWWTPDRARRDDRSICTMRLIMQCYAFTWDPALLALAEATTDLFHDREGAILLSKDRPLRSTTYKTQVDVAGLLDAWRITGRRRYHDMAEMVSRYWWRGLIGAWPIFYFNPQGRIGQFLYDETGDPSYAQGLLMQMRQAATAFYPDTGKVIASQDGRVGAHDASFVFSGIPFAQEVVVRANADRGPAASWLSWDDYGAETRIYVKKDDTETFVVDMVSAGSGQRSAGGVTAAHTVQGQQYGLDMVQVDQWADGAATVRLTKDAPAGCYVIETGALGQHTALAHGLSPMVLYAPGYWQPRPDLAVPPRWHFNVPKDAKAPRICLDGTAKLYDPTGKALSEEKLLSGWVDLPTDRPGLWSFEPVNVKAVCVQGLPPFFAPGSPRSHFTPEIGWRPEERPAAQPVPPGTTYVAGPGGDAVNKALYLDGRRVFKLDAGQARPDGDGTQFLAFRQGTIEFFVKPGWDVSDLPDGTPALVLLPTAKENWSLWYWKNSKGVDWKASHVLYGMFMSHGKSDVSSLRAYRRTVFAPGEWAHVAWVWGPVSRTNARGQLTSALVARVYVNGKAGQQWGYTLAGNTPRDVPKALMLQNALPAKDTAYDELRVSDVMRYTGDFTPPARGAAFRPDEHTRALFHFDGNLHGESAGHEGPMPATILP